MLPESPFNQAAPGSDVPPASLLKRRVRWLILIAAVIAGLTGFGYAASILLTHKSAAQTAPTPSPQAPVTAAERAKVSDSTLPSTQLDVTALTAQNAELQTLLAKALQVSTNATIQGNLTVGGNGTFGGTLSAANFTGSGAGLTGVDAALLGGRPGSFYSGLATNVAGAAQLGSPNTFTSANSFTAGVTATGISDSGALSVAGATNLAGTTTIASLILSSPLTVPNGGTGLTSVPAASVMYGQGGPTLGVATPASAGLCLLSGATDVQWGSCSGAAAGVATLDNLSGVLNLANSTGVGATITIDNASAVAKGIASFNATNFSVVNGAVNTIQNIATTSAPTFAGLTLTGALTVANGGTGAATLGANGVLLGNGAGAIGSLVAGGAGSCLVSTAAAPVWTSCPGAGGVSSVNTLTGALTVANATTSGGNTITINNAAADGATKGIAAFNATNFSAAGGVVNTVQNIATTASPTFAGLTLSNQLTVANGGTGAITLAANGVLLGNGASPISSLATATPNQCLVSTAGAPNWASCPGAGGVTTLDTQSGVVTIANTTGSGGVVTIQDAGTAQKGIVQFNATNFSVAGGVADTVQDIAVTSTPTFGGLTDTGSLGIAGNTQFGTPGNLAKVAIQGLSGQVGLYIRGQAGQTSPLLEISDGNLNVNAQFGTTGNVLTLGRIASSGTVTQGQLTLADGTTDNFGLTLQPATLTASRTVTLPDATGTVCLNTGNCLGGASGGANTALSNLASVAINTSLLPGAAGTINLGSGTLPFGQLFIAGTSASPASNNFTITGAATAARTITLPDATGTVCLTTGNCAGAGTGVTTTGGTTNQIAKFTGSQVLGDSSISDTGTSVTVKPTSDSTSTFQIQNAAGSTNMLGVGTSAASSSTLQGGSGGLSLLTIAASGNTGAIRLQSGDSSSGTSGNVIIDTGASAVSAGTNLEHDTFETGTDNWTSAWSTNTPAQSTTFAKSGTHSLTFTTSAADWSVAGVYPGGAVTAGNLYHFGLWVRGTTSSAGTIELNVCWINSSPSTCKSVSSFTGSTSSGWVQLSGDATAPTGSTNVQVSIHGFGGASSDTVYLDEVTADGSSAAPVLNLGGTNAASVLIGSTGMAGGTIVQGGVDGVTLTSGAGDPINIGTETDNITTIGDSAGTEPLKLQGQGISQTITGSATTPSDTIKTTTNSTQAFQVQNAAGTNLLGIDTANSQETLGTSNINTFGNTYNDATNPWGGFPKDGYYDGTGKQMLVAQQFTTSGGGALSSLSTYIGDGGISATNKLYQMAVYTDNGSDQPGTYVGSTAVGTLNASASWNTLPITATLAPHTKYWLVYWTNVNDTFNNGQDFTNAHPSNQNAQMWQTYETWQCSSGCGASTNGLPNTYPTAGSTGGAGYEISIYATYANNLPGLQMDGSGNTVLNGTALIQSQAPTANAFEVADSQGNPAIEVDTNAGTNFNSVGINCTPSFNFNLHVCAGGNGNGGGAAVTGRSYQLLQVLGTGGYQELNVDSINDIVQTADLQVGDPVDNQNTAGSLVSDNFESGNFSLWSGGSSGSITADTGKHHGGRVAAEVNVAGSTGYARTGFSSSSNTLTINAWAYVQTLPGSGELPLLTLYQSSTPTNKVQLYIDQFARLGVINGTTDLGVGAGNAQINGGAWARFALTINRTTGEIDIDGADYNPIFGVATAFTGLTIGSGWDTLQMGTSTASTGQYWLDDLILREGILPAETNGLVVQDSLHTGGSATIGGQLLAQGGSNSAVAFQVQDTSSNDILNVDTANAKVTVATTANGGGFINNGSLLNSAKAMSNYASSGNLGTAAATVDKYTTFTIPQTTSSVDITVPSPTDTTAGRIVYISNTGSASFTLNTSAFTVASGKSVELLWNGTAWTGTTGSGSGVSTVGGFSGSSQTNGALISGTTITFGPADTTNPGMVSTGTQTFGGGKTFQATSATALQIQNAGGTTTLLVADTSSDRLYVGPTAGDTTGALLVLGNKTNSGDPTGVVGSMYYNSSTGSFRCYSVDHWENCLQDARNTYHYKFDMEQNSGDNVGAFAASGAAAGAGDIGGLASHPGIEAMSTGTTTTGYDAYGLNDGATNAYLLGSGGSNDYWRHESDVTIPTLSNVTDRYIVRTGFTNNPISDTAAGVYGCYFKYSDNLNSGNWQGICTKNGTTSTCDTGTNVTNTPWYRLTVSINSAGTAATFQVNGATSGTGYCQVTTNLPNQATIFETSITKTAGTTARELWVDYIDVYADFGTSR